MGLTAENKKKLEKEPRIQELATVQIKTIIASFEKTCITSLPHNPLNLAEDNRWSFAPLAEVRSSCHREPFPRGKSTATPQNFLRGWIQR